MADLMDASPQPNEWCMPLSSPQFAQLETLDCVEGGSSSISHGGDVNGTDCDGATFASCHNTVAAPEIAVATTHAAKSSYALPSPPPASIFQEVLECGAPHPTEEELEEAGLFDVDESLILIAEWRKERGVPSPSLPGVEFSSSGPSSPTHHSQLTIDQALAQDAFADRRLSTSTIVTTAYPTLSLSRPSSPSPSTSPRLSPLAFVRKAMRPPKPLRTQSTSDLPHPKPAPLVSPLILDTANANPWERTLQTALAVDERIPGPVCRASFSGSGSTHLEVASRPGPNKLRKSMPGSIPSIRTDQAYLDQSANSGVRSPCSPSTVSPLSAKSSSSKKWRKSLNFGSSPFSISQSSLELPSPDLARSSSPSDAFPSSARREGALTPVDRRDTRKKRGSTSSSDEGHLGDGEENPSSASRRSPALSPTTKSGLWGKALKMGRAGSAASHHHKTQTAKGRPSSVGSAEGWSIIDQDEITPPVNRSFEVVTRPKVGRSYSANSVQCECHDLSRSGSIGGVLSEAASTSSPNLSKIDEEEGAGSLYFSGSASKRSSATRLGLLGLRGESRDGSTEGRRTRTQSANTILRTSSRPGTPPPASGLQRVLTHDSSTMSTESDSDDVEAYHSPRTSLDQSDQLKSSELQTRVSSSSLARRARQGALVRRELTSESDLSSLASSSNWEHDDGNETPASSAMVDASDYEEDESASLVVEAKPLESIPVEGGEVVGWR